MYLGYCALVLLKTDIFRADYQRSPAQSILGEYPDAEQSLRAWLSEAKRARWSSPNELRQAYANADIVGNSRVVFNIRGNHYRLIVAVSYVAGVVLVKFVGTHTEYDDVDAATVDLYGRER